MPPCMVWHLLQMLGSTGCARVAPGARGLHGLSKQLRFLSADLDGAGAPERAPLFDAALAEALWRFEPNDLRLAQLHFFEADCAVN